MFQSKLLRGIHIVRMQTVLVPLCNFAGMLRTWRGNATRFREGKFTWNRAWSPSASLRQRSHVLFSRVSAGTVVDAIRRGNVTLLCGVDALAAEGCGEAAARLVRRFIEAWTTIHCNESFVSLSHASLFWQPTLFLRRIWVV